MYLGIGSSLSSKTQSPRFIQPTPQQLLDLSAGLGRSELVNNVQRRLAVGVSHRGIDATLPKREEQFSQFKSYFYSLQKLT